MDEVREEEVEDEGPPRRAAWHLVLILLLTMGLGAMVAYHTAQPGEPPPANPVAEARPGPHDLMIVPGQRVDVVTLGLNVEEVEKRWGKALIRPTEDGQVYQFDQMAVTLLVREDRVESILVKNEAFRTRGGAVVHGDIDLVMRELGKAYEYEKKADMAYGVRYWDKGIHFVVEKTVITSIQVSEPVFGHSPEPGEP